ncbi:hypothetical protein AKJ16_DCAP07147 [Drosera capensis]
MLHSARIWFPEMHLHSSSSFSQEFIRDRTCSLITTEARTEHGLFAEVGASDSSNSAGTNWCRGIACSSSCAKGDACNLLSKFRRTTSYRFQEAFEARRMVLVGRRLGRTSPWHIPSPQSNNPTHWSYLTVAPTPAPSPAPAPSCAPAALIPAPPPSPALPTTPPPSLSSPPLQSPPPSQSSVLNWSWSNPRKLYV